MENKYSAPEAEIIEFDQNDLLQMSPGGEGKPEQENW